MSEDRSLLETNKFEVLQLGVTSIYAGHARNVCIKNWA